MENRLTELEIKLGLAEELLEELNRSVFRQQQQIGQLQQEVRLLHRQVQDSMPEEQRVPGDEVPPHY